MTKEVTTPEPAPGRRLADTRVLVVGAGALGCAAALPLAAAGVGRLVLIDPDRVELSNLHRQLLYRTNDLGKPKTVTAAARLLARFPSLRVEPIAARLDAGNLPELFARVDFVVDATDGVAGKFLVNDGAVRSRRAFSHAGVLGFLGQTLTVLPGRSACFRCLFPEPPAPGEVPSCREAGVIGGIAGLIGGLQAAEAIKYLTGAGALATDVLLSYDARSGRWRRVRLTRNPHCPVCAGLHGRRRTATAGRPEAFDTAAMGVER